MRLVSILTLALPPAFGFTSHVVHPSLGNGGVVKTRPKVIDRPIHHQTFASTSTALAAVPSVDSDALLTFFLQKLIETSVPTLGVIAVIAFGASVSCPLNCHIFTFTTYRCRDRYKACKN